MTSHLDKINAFIDSLDPTTLTALQNITVTKTFKKGHFLLSMDEICKKSYVLESGIARKYDLHDGKEITTELFFKDDIAISLHSYVQQTPSREFIQAITDVSVTVTDYKAFQMVKTQYPRLMELDLLMTEYYAIWLEDRLFQFHTLDATARYLQLLQKQPHIVQYVPLTYIASYLGISLETLSRIRAKLT